MRELTRGGVSLQPQLSTAVDSCRSCPRWRTISGALWLPFLGRSKPASASVGKAAPGKAHTAAREALSPGIPPQQLRMRVGLMWVPLRHAGMHRAGLWPVPTGVAQV